MPPFCLTAGGNICQCNYKTTENISKTSSDHLTKFYGRSSLLFWPGQPSWECWFPQLSQKQCGAFVLITFSCEPSLYANCPPNQTKVAIMQINIRPVIIEKNVRYSGLGLCQKDMSRITGMPKGAIWKVTCRVHESSGFTQGLHRYLLKAVPFLRMLVCWWICSCGVELQAVRKCICHDLLPEGTIRIELCSYPNYINLVYWLL